MERLVRTKGTVVDAFRDEIDPRYTFIVLLSGRHPLYAHYCGTEDDDALLGKLIGAEVAATGCPTRRNNHSRNRMTSAMMLHGVDAIRILRPAPEDPFDVPPLHGESIRLGDMADISRRKASGRVLSVWHGDTFLLRTENGEISRVQLARPNPPAAGQTVSAVGIPETDLYHLNLSRAEWRATDLSIPPDDESESVTADFMLTDGEGNRKVKAAFHGRRIRMAGTVRSRPSVNDGDGRFTLESDGHVIFVDASSVPNAFDRVRADSRISVTGTCVMNIENWRPQAPFPHIDNFFLVISSPEDISIIVGPPWWTVRRLLTLVSILVAALVGILVWNALLRRLVERRSRQLLKAQIAQTSAALKVEERTRLAVELHDALSQNLSGASMQIDAARKLLKSDPAKTSRHLEMASSTLESSREELRNCIWDLRSHSLETPDMNTAIRRTLEGRLGDAKLRIRFNIPRTLFSDSTAHALLCIIRELATNAIRHGRATDIQIAGAHEGVRLCFSVRDNGVGFDPKTAVGRSQGHFGLQGIRERLKKLNGSLVLESAPNAGTKATITIILSPHTENGAS